MGKIKFRTAIEFYIIVEESADHCDIQIGANAVLITLSCTDCLEIADGITTAVLSCIGIDALGI